MIWLNSALGVIGAAPVYYKTVLDLIFMLSLVIILFTVGFYLISRFYGALRYQEQFLKDAKLFITKTLLISKSRQKRL